MSKIFLIILGIWCFTCISFTQNIAITGESPNYYLKADQIFANSVRITETLSGQLIHFEPGDKVLVIQMTGVSLDSSSAVFKTTWSRTKKTVGKTGLFEILQVDEIVKGADTLVYFTDNLSNSYDNFEKIQLVKLIEGETVTVTGTLNSKPWDGSVGGILGIIGMDTVKLANNSIIDVSARGFRGGAVPDEVYQNGLCRSRSGTLITQHDTMYFRSAELGRSGNKGEGIITTQWPYTKGSGFNINGGGAGNGLFSGGGGGSNFSAGGDGGEQSAFCVALNPVIGGMGGYACSELYDNNLKPKAILGGGGGSGTKMEGSTPSRGGNGGGMAIIITGTLVSGSGTSIRANGEHAFPINTAGSGAGGGGGGSILIDAANFAGPSFQIQIKGGNGSSTTTASPNCSGAGGGGSGGSLWHSGAVLPAAIIDNTNGSAGTPPSFIACSGQVGRSGSSGGTLTNLVVPLTGFLFNTIRGTDTICAAQVPNVLSASQPKGGNGSYDYSWQQSTDNIVWSDASGIKSLRTLAPIALNQTTYYRRIVTSVNPVTLSAINDTSRVIKIFVYPAIANNSILGVDTICFNNNAKPLQGIATPISGGNSVYSYVWQASTDQEQWTDRGTASSFDPDELSASTYFRRIVNSTAYCSDTSSPAKVTVLEPIGSNTFSISDTSICKNTSPGQISITAPTGGDENYSYLWQYRTLDNWINLPQTSDSSRYTVGILTDTASYRRIVYSGNDNACIDTSNARNIIVRPLISNNSILGSAIQYTCYNSPVTLNGSNPANGFGAGTYSYAWEESDDNSDWQSVSANTKDYQSGNLPAKRYFRRIVFSTPQHHECSDISDPVEVRINPLPMGNVVNMFDTLCAGSTLFVKFNVSGNGPFEVSVQGENVSAVSKSGITGLIDSIAFTPMSTQQFRIISIEDDSSCLGDLQGFTPVIAGFVYDVPVADAGPDNTVCGKTYTLQAVKSNNGFKGLWTAIGATFGNDTVANSLVTMDNFGPNTFTWTESNWHCTDNEDVEIIFYEQPALPDAGPDQELNFVFQSQLTGSVPIVGEGKWSVISGSGSIDEDTKPDAFVKELEDKTSMRWTVTNGSCPEVSDSMNILIKPLVIPKAFTPDGNNKHDFFDIGAIHAERISLKVYNSAGILVFESEDYTNANEHWTGENKAGIQLPEGTYFYIANIKVAGKTEEVQFRSFVEIMR